MTHDFFQPKDRVMEALLKMAVAQQFGGYLDPRDNGSAYDCTILRPCHVELKIDHEAGKTGNCYFEIRNTYRNEPSGLAATQAEYWAHYLPHCGEVVLFRPHQMLPFLQAQVARRVRGYRLTRPAGGDQNSQGIVVPVSQVLALPFVRHWPFTLELPTNLTALSGMVGYCQGCNKRTAIEALRLGYCPGCGGWQNRESTRHETA